MPLPTQYASIAAWNDDQHTKDHRNMYRQRFNTVLPMRHQQCNVTSQQVILPVGETPGDDIKFARQLYSQYNVKVLPGKLLSQPDNDQGPGSGRVRVAMVAEQKDCQVAAERILQFLQQYSP